MADRNSKPVAVVVGVGAGLGAVFARRFAEGCRVALIARKHDFLEELTAEIKARGGDPLVVPTNVTCLNRPRSPRPFGTSRIRNAGHGRRKSTCARSRKSSDVSQREILLSKRRTQIRSAR